MRSGIALLAVAAILVAVPSGSARAARHTTTLPPWLAPAAVAFADRTHGVLGTGDGYRNSGHEGGAIEVTSDGGRTWHLALRTPRRVIAVTYDGQTWYAEYDDGESLQSTNSGHTWSPATDPVWALYGDSFCPLGLIPGTRATWGDPVWSVCSTSGGAGAEGKAVYRRLNSGWKRVACTDFAGLHLCGKHSYGGISGYGYSDGIAGNSSGFGLIWESRGTLYASHDGGRHWTGHTRLARPEIDFGTWAFVLPRGGVGWALLSRGWAGSQRLVETTDAGRTWRVVHRWPKLRS